MQIKKTLIISAFFSLVFALPAGSAALSSENETAENQCEFGIKTVDACIPKIEGLHTRKIHSEFPWENTPGEDLKSEVSDKFDCIRIVYYTEGSDSRHPDVVLEIMKPKDKSYFTNLVNISSDYKVSSFQNRDVKIWSKASEKVFGPFMDYLRRENADEATINKSLDSIERIHLAHYGMWTEEDYVLGVRARTAELSKRTIAAVINGYSSSLN